jgi:hypothetical protein
VAVDGTSLTVAELSHHVQQHQQQQQQQQQDSLYFRVSLIPHTLSHTNLAKRIVGDHVNIEFDTEGVVEGEGEGEAGEKVEEKKTEKNEYGYFWSDDDFMKEAYNEGEKVCLMLMMMMMIVMMMVVMIVMLWLQRSNLIRGSSLRLLILGLDASLRKTEKLSEEDFTERPESLTQK